MEKYFRIVWSVLFLFLIEQIPASPVPKYAPAILIDHSQQNNRIQFQDFGNLIAFDDVENRLAPLPPRKKFAPKLFAKEEERKQVYQDKIFFSDVGRVNNGYIRRFPPPNFQGQEEVNLRSLYPDAILLKSNSEEEKAPPKHFQFENDMPTTGMDVTIPVEIPGLNDRSGQDKEIGMETQTLVPPPGVLEWITRKNKTKSGNPSSEDESNKITFLSLFRVPNIERRSDFPPCPENLRRNHHGDCVRPVRRIRYRIIAEEIQQTPDEEDS